MGIPGLFSALFSRGGKYSSFAIDKMPTNVTSLSIDMNSLIHLALSIVYAYGDYDNPEVRDARRKLPDKENREQVQLLTYNIIRQIVSHVRPKHTLVIAVDGVAPMAKIRQQKQRRYKTGLMRDPNVMLFDTNAVTPGTEFMMEMDHFLSTRLMGDLLDIGVDKIIYSSHLVPGEGEHKIFEYLRTGQVPSPEAHYHVIYGMDADLIILSLLSNHNIVLARDSVPVVITDETRRPIQQKDKSKRQDKRNIFINDMRQAIINELKTETAIEDFSILISLLGNDFIPHSPIMDGDMRSVINILFEAYKRAGQTLTFFENGKYVIDLDILLSILNMLASQEGSILSEVAASDRGSSSRMYTAALNGKQFDYETFSGAWYFNALVLGRKYEWTPEGSEELTHNSSQTTVNGGDVTYMCFQFLRGIIWTFQYYKYGLNNVTWLWEYPYTHSPLIYDVAEYISFILGDKSTMDVARAFNVDPIPGEMRPNPVHQLLMVIPPTSYTLVPLELHHVYRDRQRLADLMPTSFPIETDGARNPDFGIARIPPPDYNRTVDLVASFEWQKKVWDRWLPASDLVIEDEAGVLKRKKEREDTLRKMEEEAMKREKPKREGGRGRGRGKAQAFKSRTLRSHEHQRPPVPDTRPFELDYDDRHTAASIERRNIAFASIADTLEQPTGIEACDDIPLDQRLASGCWRAQPADPQYKRDLETVVRGSNSRQPPSGRRLLM